MLGLVLAGATGLATADSLYVDATGNVGVGTNLPAQKLHVLDGNLKVEQSVAATDSVLEFTTASGTWEIKQNANTGRLTFFYPGGGATTASFKFDPSAQENLFRVGIVDGQTVDINGNLVVNGVPVADYVFSPEYDLKSIEEQSAFMFENKHLPAVQKGDENMKANINVMDNQMAILEELEKAHIYISQLNETIKEMKADMAELKAPSK